MVKQERTKKGEVIKADMPFQRLNYRLVLVGLGFLALGFILMIGGGSNDPNVFKTSIFDFQRLSLAPILLIIGYIIEIFAIMLQPKK